MLTRWKDVWLCMFYVLSFFSSSGNNFAWGRFYFINMRTLSKHFSECTQFLAYNWMHIWCPLVVYSIVPICKLNFSTKQLSSVCIVAFINKQKTNKIPFQNNACASLICLFIRSAWKAGYVAWNFILVLYILYSVTFEFHSQCQMNENVYSSYGKKKWLHTQCHINI